MKKYSYHLFLECDYLVPIRPLALTAERYTKCKYKFTDKAYVREWGVPGKWDESDTELKPLPDHVYLCYRAGVEMERYSIDHLLDDIDDVWAQYETEPGVSVFSQVLVGIAPYGQSACWLWGEKKSVVISWVKASKVKALHDISQDSMLEGFDEAKENLSLHGLPDRHLYDGYMQKYRYRYVVSLDDSFELDYIDEALFDGSHDKLHDGGLMRYHDAAKPKKLSIGWHAGKSEYSAHFWFDDSRIKRVFDECYDGKSDSDMDFIIRIDPVQNQYGVFMFRHGMAEPFEMDEDAYQLIVFKNDFEDYASENFSQKSGAWLW